MTPPSAQSSTGTRQPLAETLVALAETPDDMPGIDTRLQALVQLAADRIRAADYAAVSARPGNGSSTVAVSRALIDDLEQVPDAGPEVPAASRQPAAVAGREATTTMAWPGFRDTAADLGLHVVSVPLFTGSGAAIATLDLYGHDAPAMQPLTLGIQAAYDPDLPWPADCDDAPPLDAGGEELITGFAEALCVRATIEFALAVMTRTADTDAESAYVALRLRAAEEGASLLAAATTVINRMRPR